jgi:hypothetical protein
MDPSSWVLTCIILATQDEEINQEDHGLRPAQRNSLREPISKNPITKKGLMEWLKVEALSSNPQYSKKKKKRKERNMDSSSKKKKKSQNVHSFTNFLYRSPKMHIDFRLKISDL